ncbi:MAG: GtrA family protein [Alphaproteobacteria bacterium]|nr:GtrA family protein [Alphaproteobacteria bacterium]
MSAFGRYILSAGLASLADFALVQSLLWLDVFHTPASFGAAVVLGALCGMNVNFWVSRHFVFAPDRRRTRDQMRSFFVVSLSTLLVRLVVAYALVAILTLPLFAFLAVLPIEAAPMRLAHVGAMGLVTFYSFFAHKHISFSGGVTRWIRTQLKAVR